MICSYEQSTHLGQTLQTLDAVREQLLAFWLGHNPLPRWVEITAALLTPHDCSLLLNRLCDVDLRPYAVHAHIGGVGSNAHATEAT